jgi:hypothetical protein
MPFIALDAAVDSVAEADKMNTSRTQAQVRLNPRDLSSVLAVGVASSTLLVIQVSSIYVCD